MAGAPYINNTISYVADAFDMSLANQMKLIYMTLDYKYVMYSNHHHEAFAGFFDGHVNFCRTNGISGASIENKPSEIMAYKINITKTVVNNPSYKSKKTPSNDSA